ncbi:response regulator [Aquipuribacter hungaricus]|uniref:Response regulator n=1 Tax=Aquipuribacter hungaricus TaxID=545624 RepID=A0ABV7WCY2_9MICO
MAQVRTLVVDDHPLFARGLELLLPGASEGRVEVVGWTSEARLAGSDARSKLPDLALVDLMMPEPGGLRAIAAIRRALPACRVVAMSGSDDQDLAVAALEAGAEAFLPKSTEPEAVVTPLLAVLDGWSVVPAALLHRLTAARGDPELVRALGGAERHLWRRLAEGRSTTQIATELHVSERSVKRMTAALLRSLRVSTRMEAATLAGQVGLLADSG